ncbi:MAG: hypothetical protein LM583_07550 [Desulfurococcaceae archaeon]|nr:hypothetical protein [Desulfurococcaceae archaeon]
MKRVFLVTKIVFMNRLLTSFRSYSTSRRGRVLAKFGVALQVASLVLLIIIFIASAIVTHMEGRINIFSYASPDDPLVASSLITVFILSLLYFSGAKAIVYYPSDEFLLYQPLQLYEIYIGLYLGESLAYLLITALVLAFFLRIAPKIAYTLFFSVIFVILVLAPVIRLVIVVAFKRGYLEIVRSLLYIYIVMGVVYTVYEVLNQKSFTLSPLLLYPASAGYLLGIEMMKTLSFVAIAIYPLTCLGLGLVLAYPLGKAIDVSDFVSFEEVAFRRQLSLKELKRDLVLDWGSPEEAVKKSLLYPVFTPRRVVTRYGLGMLVALALGKAIRFAVKALNINIQVPVFIVIPVLATFLASLTYSIVYEFLLYDIKFLWILRLYLADMGIYARMLLIKSFIKVMLSAEILLLFLAELMNSYVYASAPLILPLPLVLYAFTLTLFTLPYMRRVRIQTIADVVRSESTAFARDPVTLLLGMVNIVMAYVILSTLVFVAPVMVSASQPYMFIVLAAVYVSTYVVYKLSVKLLQKKFTEVDVPI